MNEKYLNFGSTALNGILGYYAKRDELRHALEMSKISNGYQLQYLNSNFPNNQYEIPNNANPNLVPLLFGGIFLVVLVVLLKK